MTEPLRADEVLAAHGFSGDKVMAYAHTIARKELNRTASTLGDRYDDLVLHLCEVGCRTAVKYNPDKSSSTGHYTFSSYLFDVMARRVPDFYRRKGEGFGDKRKGLNDRIVLSGDSFGFGGLLTHDKLEQRDDGDFTESVVDRLDLAGY